MVSIITTSTLYKSYGDSGASMVAIERKEREERKSWLKAQHSENEDYGIWSHHFMGNR